MNYREITEQDLPSIFAVRVATWHNANAAEEMAQMGITPDLVGQLLKESSRGWLAEQDGRVIGFTIGNKDTGEMWVIAVLKEFENQGIGRSLMGCVEKWLVSEGWDQLWLTTDVDEDLRAVGFYRHLGWQDWKIEDGDRFMRKLVKRSRNPTSTAM